MNETSLTQLFFRREMIITTIFLLYHQWQLCASSLELWSGSWSETAALPRSVWWCTGSPGNSGLPNMREKKRKKKALISTAAQSGAQDCYYYSTLNTANYLSGVVFDSRESLSQPQLVKFIVSTCQDFAHLGQKESPITATRHWWDSCAFRNLHLKTNKQTNKQQM